MTNKMDGMVLLEALVATFLASIFMLALLQLGQTIVANYQRMDTMLTAWRYAHQYLEVYPDQPDITLPHHWQKSLTVQQVTPCCLQVTVMVEPPGQFKARLIRWYCQV